MRASVSGFDYGKVHTWMRNKAEETGKMPDCVGAVVNGA